MAAAKLDTGSQKEPTIKRVLRRRGSHEYFKNGTWTSNPEEADSFADVMEVAQACTRHGLNDVELALRYSTSSNDVFCTTIR